MTRAEIAKILTLFAAAFRDFVVTEERVEVWMIGCRHQSIENMAKAAELYIQNEKWPPSPAEINNLIRSIAGKPFRPAGLVWAYLITFAEKNWSSNEVLEYLKDNLPAIYTIRALGGWAELSRDIRNGDEIQFLRKDFFTIYDEIREYKDLKDRIEIVTPKRAALSAPESKLLSSLTLTVKNVA